MKWSLDFLWPKLWPPASRQISRKHWFIQSVATTVAIVLSGFLGTQYTALPGNISAVWIPDAIALAAVLIWGNQSWLGIFLGSLWLGCMDFSMTPSIMVGLTLISLGDIFTAIGSATLIKYFTKTTYPFNRAWHVLIFLIFGVGLNQVLDVMIGVILIRMIMPLPDPISIFSTWFLSGAAGIIIITPTLLTFYFLVYQPWKYQNRFKFPKINWEITIWSMLTTVVVYFAFWRRFSIEYLILVLLIWSVFRFSKPWTMITISGVSFATVIGTAQGKSVFIKDDITQSFLFLNSFVGTIAIATLFLMAVLEERSHLIHQLEQSNNHLEVRVAQRTHQLSVANAKLQELSVTDGLTQCFNRFKLDEVLNDYFARYYRHQQVFSVILFDIDYFKKVNDHYGHLVGDDLLVGVVRLCQGRLRSMDILGRWGGEEFMIICPNTSGSEARILAETLRQLLAARYFSPVGHRTASFGVAECQDKHQAPQDVIRDADEALYQAKAAGRNRTVLYCNSLNSTDPKSA